MQCQHRPRAALRQPPHSSTSTCRAHRAPPHAPARRQTKEEEELQGCRFAPDRVSRRQPLGATHAREPVQGFGTREAWAAGPARLPGAGTTSNLPRVGGKTRDEVAREAAQQMYQTARLQGVPFSVEQADAQAQRRDYAPPPPPPPRPLAAAPKQAAKKGGKREGASLRFDIDESPGAPPVAQQLRDALSKRGVRVIDMFHDWDDDGSGTVSRKEWRKAMAELGFEAHRDVVDRLFDEWDADGEGLLDYKARL